MDPVDAGRGGVASEVAAPQLLGAAAALRWSRPDLTATLAELVLDAASEPRTWAVAAGWSLHGRAAVGDGRGTAADLLDRLDGWGTDVLALMTSPDGCRLRLELAGPAHHIGEPGVVRALLSAARAGEADPELRADLLTELARCAVDDAPETADAALEAAEQAWQALGCEPGVASVKLLDASRHRRAARPGLASSLAADGLKRVDGEGRRAEMTRSDHVAAALAAEWIAALVEDGRVDEARSDAVPAAERLLALARPSRQTAKLRLAVARVSAVAESPDVVVAALEPAARDAAESDRPELESACRSMLGELHEAAGRLDVALTSVRAAMAAERSDRERTTRLRGRLADAVATWTTPRPAPSTVAPAEEASAAGRREPQAYEALSSGFGWAGPDDARAGRSGQTAAESAHDGRHRNDDAGHGDLFAGREVVGSRAFGPAGPAAGGGRTRHSDAVAATSRMASPERGADAEWSADGGSLIGDALMREFAGEPLPRRGARETDGDATGRYPDAGPGGHHPGGRSPAGQGGRGPDGHAGRVPDGHIGRVPDGRVPDGRVPDGHVPDGHAGSSRDGYPEHGSLFGPGGDRPLPTRHRRDGREAPVGGPPSAPPAGAAGARTPLWAAEPSWAEGASSEPGWAESPPSAESGWVDGPPTARHGSPRYPEDARSADPGDTVRYDLTRDANARDANGRGPVDGAAGPPAAAHRHSPEPAEHPSGAPGAHPSGPPSTPGDTSSGPQRRDRRAPGSGPSDADGLGMGDLLAGALAAYRNM